jgi:hypothetical protein
MSDWDYNKSKYLSKLIAFSSVKTPPINIAQEFCRTSNIDIAQESCTKYSTTLYFLATWALGLKINFQIVPLGGDNTKSTIGLLI